MSTLALTPALTPAPVEPLDRLAGLTTSVQIAELNERAGRERTAAVARSSLGGLTLRTALEDVYEVLVGLPADAFASPGPLSLGDLLAKNDRLRGLGILLVVGALLALLIL